MNNVLHYTFIVALTLGLATQSGIHSPSLSYGIKQHPIKSDLPEFKGSVSGVRYLHNQCQKISKTTDELEINWLKDYPVVSIDAPKPLFYHLAYHVVVEAVDKDKYSENTTQVINFYFTINCQIIGSARVTITNNQEHNLDELLIHDNYRDAGVGSHAFKIVMHYISNNYDCDKVTWRARPLNDDLMDSSHEYGVLLQKLHTFYTNLKATLTYYEEKNETRIRKRYYDAFINPNLYKKYTHVNARDRELQTVQNPKNITYSAKQTNTSTFLSFALAHDLSLTVGNKNKKFNDQIAHIEYEVDTKTKTASLNQKIKPMCYAPSILMHTMKHINNTNPEVTAAIFYIPSTLKEQYLKLGAQVTKSYVNRAENIYLYELSIDPRKYKDYSKE